MSGRQGLAHAQQQADRLRGLAHLRDVRLLRSCAELTAIPRPGRPLQWQAEITPAAEHTPGSGFLTIRISYAVTVSEEDDPPGEHQTPNVAGISFQFGALYVLDAMGSEGLQPAELDAYARSFALQDLDPYAREYVHSTTARLGLPPLTPDILAGLHASKQAVGPATPRRRARRKPPASPPGQVSS